MGGTSTKSYRVGKVGKVCSRLLDLRRYLTPEQVGQLEVRTVDCWHHWCSSEDCRLHLCSYLSKTSIININWLQITEKLKTYQNLPLPPLKQQSGKNSFGAPLTQIGPSPTDESSGLGVVGAGEQGHEHGWHGVQGMQGWQAGWQGQFPPPFIGIPPIPPIIPPIGPIIPPMPIIGPPIPPIIPPIPPMPGNWLSTAATSPSSDTSYGRPSSSAKVSENKLNKIIAPLKTKHIKVPIHSSLSNRLHHYFSPFFIIQFSFDPQLLTNNRKLTIPNNLRIVLYSLTLSILFI